MRTALVASLLASFGATAEGPTVARLKSVNGNVLVSQEAGLSTGNAAQQLTNGTRIITTANSEAVVVFENGCEIRMKENERLEVESGKPCALILAQPLGVAPVAATGLVIPAVILPIGAAGVLIGDSRNRTPVSPN